MASADRRSWWQRNCFCNTVPQKVLGVIYCTGREYRKNIELQSDLMGKGIIGESEALLLGPRFVVFIY